MARILVADDSASVRSLLVATLSCDGHTVMQAVDGISALGLLTSESFEIAVLDVRMPRLDGLTLCRRLRDATGLDHLAVIIISADSSEGEALTAGADAFLSKPFSLMRLRMTVAQFAGQDHLKRYDPLPDRAAQAGSPSACAPSRHRRSGGRGR